MTPRSEPMPTVLAPSAEQESRPAATVRLGVVSFLNALPLYETLRGREDVTIQAAVPSALAGLLEAGECDCAMLPVADYFRNRAVLELVGDACIASDGETRTVRVYSRVPPDRLRRLDVDGDSHTSVLLAQVVWRELYGQVLEIAPCSIGPGERPIEPGRAEAMLLIGDKVVRQAPRGFGFEVDLGAAWKHLTGLPFVFAAWFAPRGRGEGPLAAILNRARDEGVAVAAQLAARAAARHGWPAPAAVDYLRRTLQYRLTPAMHDAMDRFERLTRSARLP